MKGKDYVCVCVYVRAHACMGAYVSVCMYGYKVDGKKVSSQYVYCNKYQQCHITLRKEQSS